MEKEIMKPCQSTVKNKKRISRVSNLTINVKGMGAMQQPLPLPLPLPSPLRPSSAMMDSVALSDLERLNRIASGAGGTVYKVLHRPTQKFYALKVIYGNHDYEVSSRIRSEIGILCNTNHPNVVRCYGCYEHNGEIMVLLEYMEGGSLEGRRVPNESSLADMARQVLMGLEYLHNQKIVHRDIKPSNLLFNYLNQIKIADFGVSRVLASTMDNCYSSVGTMAYMSPERINPDCNLGLYDGCAGDIWSFGVSILEFYIGRFPFAVNRNDHWINLMRAISMGEPPVAPSSTSRELRHFISCCLRKDPVRRWKASRLLTHPFITRTKTEKV